MSRTILAGKDVRGTIEGSTQHIPSTPDGYAERLLKYVPSEVIALYLTLSSLLQSSQDGARWLDWTVFGFGTVVTPLYLWRLQKVHKVLQLTISTGAFVVWAFALGGPFSHLDWFAPVYGGIVLSIYTFLIPVVEA